jgi:hypothetical protein
METTNELKYIPMYKSYIDAVAKLTPEDRLVIYEAIFEYGFTGTEPTFDNPYLQMGWNLVKPNLVNNIANMAKNAKNGSKGGRPKKVEEVKQEAPKESTKAPSTKSEELIPEPKEEALESIFGAQRSIIEEREEESFLESLEEYGDDEDEDEVKNYSTITLKLNNETIVSVPMEMVEYFNKIPTKAFNKLKRSVGQIDFEYMLEKLNNSWLSTRAILNGTL